MATTLKGQSPVAHSSSGPVHSISPEIVQAVAEELPKYAPPAPAKAAESPPEEKNDNPDIFLLPKVTVRADAPSALTEFDMLTLKGRVALAMKSYPGLRTFNLFGLNDGIAVAMQTEEKDVEKRAALTTTVRRTTSDNSPESQKMEQLLKAALQRPNAEWLTGSPGKY